MSWGFNPAEPTGQPVRSGLRETGEGDDAPAVAPYYRVQVPHGVGIGGLALWPTAKGEHVLAAQESPTPPTAPAPASPWIDPLAARHWTSAAVDPLGNYWILAFGARHLQSTPTNPLPLVAANSWSLWFGPVDPLPQHDYVLWKDPDFESRTNRFLPLHANTFRTRLVRAGSLGTGDFSEFPSSLTIQPWWP